jgi:hypothetical protein
MKMKPDAELQRRREIEQALAEDSDGLGVVMWLLGALLLGMGALLGALWVLLWRWTDGAAVYGLLAVVGILCAAWAMVEQR